PDFQEASSVPPAIFVALHRSRRFLAAHAFQSSVRQIPYPLPSALLRQPVLYYQQYGLDRRLFSNLVFFFLTLWELPNSAGFDRERRKDKRRNPGGWRLYFQFRHFETVQSLLPRGPHPD